jgi:hypothetical protein
VTTPPETPNNSGELQRKATARETIAHEKTEEFLTGGSPENATNGQGAKDWRIKSEFWLEAYAALRADVTD